MQFNISLRAIVAVSSIAALSTTAVARLLDIKLSELVAASEEIVYGRVSPANEGADGTIMFVTQIVLKGPGLQKDRSLAICNAVDDSESLDLRAVRKQLVIFAKPHGNCLMPVHGISSTIVVSNGIASTAAIVDQPGKQSISGFLRKIRDIEASEQ